MNSLKYGKLTALSLALALVVGCTSKGGETDSDIVDPNAGVITDGVEQGTIDSTYGSEFDSAYTDSEEATLRSMTTFYFAYDSSELKPEALRALDVHARDLQRSGSRVVLEGHTDERGTREYNMALGERRALAVQRYLVLQGVSPAQLELVSYGEERAAVVGHNEDAWSLNRRVELRK